MAPALTGTFSATIASEQQTSGGHTGKRPINRVIMQAEQLKELVINALEDVKAQDISVIDVRDRTSVTDFMVLASGTSNRHVKSLADSVVGEAKDKGVRASNVEGGAASDWILVDLGDVVVHVMMPATREFYDLERFWRDAPDLGVQAANNHAVTSDLRGAENARLGQYRVCRIRPSNATGIAPGPG